MEIGSVKVGPHTFSVERNPDLPDREANGETYAEKCKIVIDESLRDTRLREVLLHEILHAIWHNTGLRVEMDGEQEEKVISSLAPGLLGVLRDNPMLLEFLESDDG